VEKWFGVVLAGIIITIMLVMVGGFIASLARTLCHPTDIDAYIEEANAKLQKKNLTLLDPTNEQQRKIIRDLTANSCDRAQNTSTRFFEIVGVVIALLQCVVVIGYLAFKVVVTVKKECKIKKTIEAL
jgi:predicted PurR-regulated permease PerM